MDLRDEFEVACSRTEIPCHRYLSFDRIASGERYCSLVTEAAFVVYKQESETRSALCDSLLLLAKENQQLRKTS